ncbi:MAG: M3 family oligoendopeptidase [Candidatus Nitrosothermus koennekii]|nr:MAG: M3 family oligoendopeptidase [Candidatus Nitrosothermus koennekii]
MQVTLGRWSLDELIKDPKSIDKELDKIEKQVKELENKKSILRNDISIDEFKDIIKRFEDLYEQLSKISGYVHLWYYSDLRSNQAAALVSKVERIIADISNRLLFFNLWFKKELDEENANRLINGMDKQYRDYLRHKRLLAKYTLSEKEEKIINILEVTGSHALVKVYDKITDTFEFIVSIKKDGKIIKRRFKNKEKMLTLVRSTKPEEREGAYKALLTTYGKNSMVLGEIYSNIATKWYDEYVKLRGYNSPISVRNVSNNIDDTTVDTLLKVCRVNANIFQDYFRIKAKLLDVKRLRRYDIYAPLKAQKKFSYEQAVKLVLDAFNEFDHRFRKYAEDIFKKKHVDSELREGKRSGAFCYTVTPKILPYVLLNFDGTSRGVSTIAHEFGHAMHSIISSDKSILVHDAPLPLAETASVFAEMLLNDRLERIVSKKDRISLLVEEIDDMYATILRQSYFTLFEIDAHNKIIDNATIDDVSKIYLNNLREQFGNSIRLSDDFKYEWLYIPHFYHTPFYCYAYAFGNLLALSLYQEYKSGNKGFNEKYFSILNAGGSRKPESLLLEHGFDISKEEFWNKGFELIRSKIDELKALA